MLPPGTFKALKGYPNEIVMVVVAAMAIGAIAVTEYPWSIVAVVVAVLVAYDKRSSNKEKHDHAMALRRVEEAVAKADAVKAKHRVAGAEQQDLQLEREPQRLIEARPRGRRSDK